jgi:hypothetical protein
MLRQAQHDGGVLYFLTLSLSKGEPSDEQDCELANVDRIFIPV